MQLNEFKITSDAELEAWKQTWDGSAESVPEEVHRYMRDVVFPAREQRWQMMDAEFRSIIQNENS